MLLHTPRYLLFLLLVVLLYERLPAGRARKLALLCASYLFYALFDLRFALLLAALTAAVYFLARAIAAGRHPRLLAALSVILNLGLLGLFKYANFFLENLQIALGRPPSPALALILPIGISFYTFQSISYTTEIYRKKLAPASWSDLALYLAFFPRLIAGPFVSPAAFLAQCNQPPAPPDRRTALGLLLRGLVKKMIIADSLAGLADVAYRAADLPGVFPAPLYVQGFYLYAIQLYADFSGYTDLARGSALLLGFQLPQNFRQPYLAVTLTDFWNRWHMSLTQWFREYLFFPLSRALLSRSGRRYPRLIQIVANLVTMLLIGLWHGAAWSFIAWGAWHGILLSIERLLNLKPVRRWQSTLTALLTFHLVGVGWVLFRSSSFIAAGRFLAGLFSFQQMQWLPHYLPAIFLAGGLTLALDLWESERLRLPGWLRAVVTIAALVTLLALLTLSVVRGSDARPFIYGQF